MKKLQRLFALLLCMGFFTIQAQIIEFTYYDTLRYEGTSFTSTETVFNDINDIGFMVGYYEDDGGYNHGLVYTKEGGILTFDYPGYDHTEITGINNNYKVIGKAYNSTTSPIIFQADVETDGVVNESELTWNDFTGSNKDVGKINDSNLGTGTVKIANNRWLHIEEVIAPFSVNQNERYTTPSPFTTYNTFGMGINNGNFVTGYYLDGSDRVPYVYEDAAGFVTLNHADPTLGIPGTYIKDINDNNFVAVEYKSLAGWQGTVGFLFGANVSYQTNFPFQGALGSAVNGINNQNEIVGSYTNAAGETVAYWASTAIEYPNFDPAINGLSFSNYDTLFQYLSTDYNYITQDPYLGTADSFFHNRLDTFVSTDPAEALALFQSCQLYPSWPAFVATRPENISYITQTSGVKIPKFMSLNKWLVSTNQQYTGNCFALSAFVLAHMDGDISDLIVRFPNITAMNNASEYQLGVLDFHEMFFTLQEQQLGQHLLEYKETFDYLETLTVSGISTNLRDEIKRQVGIIADAISSPEYLTEARVMGIRTPTGSHAVVPYKITRPIDLNQSVDTVYCYDPNYPSTFVKYVFDYGTETYVLLDANNTYVKDVKYVVAHAQIDEIQVGATISFKPETGAPQLAVKSTNSDLRSYSVSNACDYTVSNTNNSAEILSVDNGVVDKQWADLVAQYDYNEDAIPDGLWLQSNESVTANLSGCDGSVSWLLSYPAGDLAYRRDDMINTETDIVTTSDKYIKVENTDAIEKDASITSFYGPDDIESVVMVSDIQLAQGDTVMMQVLDQNAVLLANGINEDKDYNLQVKYIDPTHFFEWEAEGVTIDGVSNHTILIQPNDDNNQVIILVDEDQDGSIEDTIGGAVSSAIFELNEIASIQVYPNPVVDFVKVELEVIRQGIYYIQIIDALGKIVNEDTIMSAIQTEARIDMSDSPSGVYMVSVLNGNGEVVAIHKIMK